jgi:hypothetical protein
MRCTICDVLLNEFESTKKYAQWHALAGEYLDICSKCEKEINQTVNFVVDFNAAMLDHDTISEDDSYDGT